MGDPPDSAEFIYGPCHRTSTAFPFSSTISEVLVTVVFPLVADEGQHRTFFLFFFRVGSETQWQGDMEITRCGPLRSARSSAVEPAALLQGNARTRICTRPAR